MDFLKVAYAGLLFVLITSAEYADRPKTQARDVLKSTAKTFDSDTTARIFISARIFSSIMQFHAPRSIPHRARRYISFSAALK